MTKVFPVVKISDDLSVVVDKDWKLININEFYIWCEYKCILTHINLPALENKDEGALKVIATIGERKIGLPLILVPEENIDTIAHESTKGRPSITGHPLEAKLMHDLFIEGYWAAPQREYREEDIRKAFEAGSLSARINDDVGYGFNLDKIETDLNNYLASLQKEKEIVSVELECQYTDGEEVWDKRTGDVDGLTIILKVTYPGPEPGIVPVKINYANS